MPKPLPQTYTLHLGCDPELFISTEVGKVRKRQAIVGSEFVIPPEGLKDTYNQAELVRDGVQVEMHPKPSWCRANISNYVQAGFRTLDSAVKEASTRIGIPLKVDFRSVVRLTPGDLKKLSVESQRLGCIPSKNVYGRKNVEKDGTKYLVRSAAGHIHFGCDRFKQAVPDPTRLVKVCDVLIGNTCVLVDRDPMAATRRRVYGRAGEYRLPTHGLEYRTLSNFWLHSYPLMSMVFGLAKAAFHIVSSHGYVEGPYSKGTYMLDAEERLMKNVDLKRVEQAINTGDWELAKANYDEWVKPMLADLSYDNGIDYKYLEDFEYFTAKIREAELRGDEQPLKVWFPDDPLKHWMTKPEGHVQGWERWLSQRVRAKRLAAKIPEKVTGVVTVPTTPNDMQVWPPAAPQDITTNTNYNVEVQ